MTLQRASARVDHVQSAARVDVVDQQGAATGRVFSVAFDEAAIADTAAMSAHDLAEVIDFERCSIHATEALARLPRTQRDLLHKHYWQEKDLLTAGAELGRSKSWASRNHAEAIDRLRHDMRELLDAA